MLFLILIMKFKKLENKSGKEEVHGEFIGMIKLSIVGLKYLKKISID